MKLFETIADIAYTAGQKGYYSGNSRADMQDFIYWAKEFEKKHKKIDWEETILDYMEEIEHFANEKMPQSLLDEQRKEQEEEEMTYHKSF